MEREQSSAGLSLVCYTPADLSRTVTGGRAVTPGKTFPGAGLECKLLMTGAPGLLGSWLPASLSICAAMLAASVPGRLADACQSVLPPCVPRIEPRRQAPLPPHAARSSRVSNSKSGNSSRPGTASLHVTCARSHYAGAGRLSVLS